MQILVVDDDVTIRETLRFVLEDAGFTVVEAATGLSTLEVLRSSPEPLVVLLDQLMPGMDGTDILRVVAQDTSLASRHAFVLVTASSHIAQIEAALHALPNVAVPLVRKPFNVDRLLATVETAAGRVRHAE
jgi:CheY-like chemotaxis protein